MNKAILEADMTTPMSGRDESADLFFSQLDEEEADKAAANFNRAVSSKDACYTVAAAPKCPPEGNSGSVVNAAIALKDGCTFVLESPGFGAGSKYPNGPYTCTWTFTVQWNWCSLFAETNFAKRLSRGKVQVVKVKEAVSG